MVDENGRARVRRAGVDDVAEVVRLRAAMLEAMGEPRALLDQAWRTAASAWFRERLAGPDLAVLVVDSPDGGLVASAAGLRESHAPSGRNPGGGVGWVFNVVTDPGHRRRGLARACTAALVAWFTDRTDVGVLELSATPDGDALYRSLGFVPVEGAVLQLRVSR